ncbi:VOC family protein [Phenylobacterium sp.]|uniref:VOC family protein n=1 Tax=Phenylobacterium sp. TaxID=1871053 RepID=UPI002F9575FA
MALKLDHVTVLVGSLERSMPYYDTLLPLLGFTKTRDHNWTDGDGFYFQFREAKAGLPGYERYGAGMNHLGFAAPNEAAVLAVRDGMRAAGYDAPEVQELGGAKALFMKDADGIRFEITCYPPGVPPVG